MSEGKEEKLRTIKLLVVGEAAVGKTTLLLSLQRHNTKQAIKPLATDGVDLGELILEDAHFICYDFAGQVLVCSATFCPFFGCGICRFFVNFLSFVLIINISRLDVRSH